MVLRLGVDSTHLNRDAQEVARHSTQNTRSLRPSRMPRVPVAENESEAASHGAQTTHGGSAWNTRGTLLGALRNQVNREERAPHGAMEPKLRTGTGLGAHAARTRRTQEPSERTTLHCANYRSSHKGGLGAHAARPGGAHRNQARSLPQRCRRPRPRTGLGLEHTRRAPTARTGTKPGVFPFALPVRAHARTEPGAHAA